MDLHTFTQSTKTDAEPAPSLSQPLIALWWDAKDDWELAHTICQEANSTEGDWVHAYLHRKEGDISNARYWYSRCAKEPFNGSLENEWSSIAQSLIEAQNTTT